MGKKIMYSLLVIIAFTAFFYFYQAAIFEAQITEGELHYTHDISLRAFVDYTYLGEAIYSPKITSVVPTIKGWLLLTVCLIGLPIMIGIRLVLLQAKSDTNNKE